MPIRGGIYGVDPQRDTQYVRDSADPVSPSATEIRVGAGDDSLAKQMESFLMSATRSGQVRRNRVNVSRPDAGTSYHGPYPAPSSGPVPTLLDDALVLRLLRST